MHGVCPALLGRPKPARGHTVAPLLTKTLLFIGQGLLSAKFRAFDKKTGEEIWEVDLPAKSSAAPITYMLGGKQYIVVAVGGGDQPDELVAFALR